MVRVASSNLVSRSKYGALVKRLYSGLQIRIVQFDSETRLHKVAQVVKLVDTRDLKSLGTYTSVSVRLRPRAPLQKKWCNFMKIHTDAQVVKLVDTRDLKSLGTYTSVSVRLRPRAPLLTILEISPTKQKSRTIEICLKIVCSIQFTDQLWM